MLRRALLLAFLFPLRIPAAETVPRSFFEEHCYDCHDADERKGGLDLASLSRDFASPESFARWVKVYDRVELREMPPKKKPQPEPDAKATTLRWLHDSLLAAESARMKEVERTGLRRLTRAEYENTIRDLFEMPGIALSGDLPPDGSAHGFDKNADALDISHVNLARYIDAADHTL